MTSPSFATASYEKLIELLQEKSPLPRNSYHVFQETLDTAMADFVAELCQNAYRSAPCSPEAYFHWLDGRFCKLKISFNSDCFEEQLAIYGEDYLSFPGYTNPALDRILDTDLNRLYLVYDSPEERAEVQKIRDVHKIFKGYLINRKFREMKEHIRDSHFRLVVRNGSKTDCPAEGSSAGVLPIRHSQNALFDHFYEAIHELVPQVRSTPEPFQISSMLEARMRKTDRLGRKLRDEIEENLERLPNEKQAVYLKSLKEKTEESLKGFLRQEYLPSGARETKQAMERLEAIAHFRTCKKVFLKDLLSFIRKKLEVVALETPQEDGAAPGKDLSINRIILMLDHSGILRYLREQTDIKGYKLLAIMFNKNVDNFRKKLTKYYEDGAKKKTLQSQEDEDLAYAWYQSALRGKRKE